MKYKFSKPYKFEDKEYSEIELDLDGLKGSDIESAMLQVEDLTRTGQRIPTAASWKFLAAKATEAARRVFHEPSGPRLVKTFRNGFPFFRQLGLSSKHPVQDLKRLCVRLSLTDCKLSFLDWYNMPIRDLLEWSKILLSELEKVRKLEEKAFKKPR